MPNIAAVLREEIARLSRREARSHTLQTRKATTRHRREIAQLKRKTALLERQIAVLAKRMTSAAPAAAPVVAERKMRFVAKGLRSHRARLGLSAAQFGKLVGVGAQSVYNWERGAAHPRAAQLASIASLRAVGKREATSRLKALAPAKAKKSSAGRARKVRGAKNR